MMDFMELHRNFPAWRHGFDMFLTTRSVGDSMVNFFQRGSPKDCRRFFIGRRGPRWGHVLHLVGEAIPYNPWIIAWWKPLEPIVPPLSTCVLYIPVVLGLDHLFTKIYLDCEGSLQQTDTLICTHDLIRHWHSKQFHVLLSTNTFQVSHVCDGVACSNCPVSLRKRLGGWSRLYGINQGICVWQRRTYPRCMAIE
jgi:hypothetical protein